VSASRIPPALARRLDRLAARAHRFHRFAHHPLCGAYAGETLRLGRRTRLCRGCAAAALGAVLGLAAGLALPVPAGSALLGASALLAPAMMGAVRPRREERAPAPGKLLTRATPACAAAALALLGVRSGSAPGLAGAALALALIAWATRAYRRRGPDRRPCADCPERAPGKVCSGFSPMARREAAFARAAARLLRAVPPPPPPR
jgi:hypothetical protein